VGDGGGWYGIRDNVVGSLVEQQAGGGGNVGGDYLTHLTNLYSTILVKCVVEPSNVGNVGMVVVMIMLGWPGCVEDSMIIQDRTSNP